MVSKLWMMGFVEVKCVDLVLMMIHGGYEIRCHLEWRFH